VDFRKHTFWIVLAWIVLVAIGLWAVIVPSVQATTDELRDQCKSKIDTFRKLAGQAGQGDILVNAKHVELADKYSQRLAEQLDGLRKELESKKLEVRFDDAPQPSGQFDIWLSEKRQKIMKQAADAGLQLPPEADKLMFREPATDDNSRRLELHRGYRLRQMAIVEEVVDILSKKYGKQQVLKFQPEKDTPEPQEQADAGAQALERLSIALPRSVLQAADPAKDRGAEEKTATATAAGATSEDRARVVLEEAMRRSGAKAAPSSKSAAPVEPFVALPYSVTSLDIQFVAPLTVVPAIAKALECSNRWTAVISRVEYERSSPAYPVASEPKMAKAGPVPGLNTHYQEAPVRALVSLDLYEYDEAKAKAARPAAPAKKDAAKK